MFVKYFHVWCVFSVISLSLTRSASHGYSLVCILAYTSWIWLCLAFQYIFYFFYSFCVECRICKYLLCLNVNFSISFLILIYMLNMFTFIVFSVCHSLGQSVTCIALLIFCLIPQEYSFLLKFIKRRILVF